MKGGVFYGIKRTQPKEEGTRYTVIDMYDQPVMVTELIMDKRLTTGTIARAITDHHLKYCNRSSDDGRLVMPDIYLVEANIYPNIENVPGCNKNPMTQQEFSDIEKTIKECFERRFPEE